MTDTALADDIVTIATRSLADRIDTDLRGAYRAGYTYLYIGHPQPAGLHTDELRFHVVTLPTDACLDWRALPDEYRWEQYDLTSITPTEYRDAVGTTR